jgi:hypothetical protein
MFEATRKLSQLREMAVEDDSEGLARKELGCAKKTSQCDLKIQ